MKRIEFTEQEQQHLMACLDETLRAKGIAAIEAVFPWYMKIKTAPTIEKPADAA